MIQRADDARFTLESLSAFEVVRECRWENLEGNRAVEFQVFSDEDLAHPARTELADDAVMQERRPNHCKPIDTAKSGHK